MAWRALISIAILALVANVTPVPADSYAVHEIRGTVSSRWDNLGRVEPHAILPVRIGLTQRNIDNGPSYLMDVSDPMSPNYSKHWTSEQVIEAFKPTDETTNAVMAWLNKAGIHNITISDNKAWLAFNRPASQIESLLYTHFDKFKDRHTGRVVPSTERYHVPKAIQAHIDYISPGVKLLAPRIKARELLRDTLRRPANSFPNEGTKSCDKTITPSCVAALYQIPPATLTPNPENIMGIYESQFQRWDQTDLNLFFANFTNSRIPQNTRPINFAIDGGNSKTPHAFVSKVNGGETMLDLDIAYPIVYPQTIGIWDENDLYYQRTQENNDTITWGFNQLLDSIDGSYCTYTAFGEKGDDPSTFKFRVRFKGAILTSTLDLDPTYPDPEKHGGYNGTLECGVFTPPKVLSISYGGQENTVPIAYQRRQCNEWLKLGLRGTSVLFASGDAGVADFPAQYGGQSPTGCIGINHAAFNPTWPNTCPWLTNVGATEVYPGSSVHQAYPESAAYFLNETVPSESFASGGGFSNIYPIPQYQKTAVENYFAKHNPPYEYYSQLAKVAPNPVEVNVTELQGGNAKALYNRIGRGVPDVAANGWHGAVVVQGAFVVEAGTSQSTPIFASIINRIVEERLAKGKKSLGFLNPALYMHPDGLNDIINGTNPGCGTKGFSTAPGWDPVTGLGTPNFPKMLEIFMSLP